MKVVKVKWVDCDRTEGWVDKSVFQEWIADPNSEMTSVGFLAHDGKKHIVILQTVSSNQVGEAMQIPRSLVLELEELADTDIEL
jgi:hypothetical protein